MAFSHDQMVTLGQQMLSASVGGAGGQVFAVSVENAETCPHAASAQLAHDPGPDDMFVISGVLDDEDEIERTLVLVIAPDGSVTDSFEVQ